MQRDKDDTDITEHDAVAFKIEDYLDDSGEEMEVELEKSSSEDEEEIPPARIRNKRVISSDEEESATRDVLPGVADLSDEEIAKGGHSKTMVISSDEEQETDTQQPEPPTKSKESGGAEIVRTRDRRFAPSLGDGMRRGVQSERRTTTTSTTTDRGDQTNAADKPDAITTAPGGEPTTTTTDEGVEAEEPIPLVEAPESDQMEGGEGTTRRRKISINQEVQTGPITDEDLSNKMFAAHFGRSSSPQTSQTAQLDDSIQRKYLLGEPLTEEEEYRFNKRISKLAVDVTLQYQQENQELKEKVEELEENKDELENQVENLQNENERLKKIIKKINQERENPRAAPAPTATAPQGRAAAPTRRAPPPATSPQTARRATSPGAAPATRRAPPPAPAAAPAPAPPPAPAEAPTIGMLAKNIARAALGTDDKWWADASATGNGNTHKIPAYVYEDAIAEAKLRNFQRPDGTPVTAQQISTKVRRAIDELVQNARRKDGREEKKERKAKNQERDE